MTRQFLPDSFVIPEDPQLKDVVIQEYLEQIAAAVNSIPEVTQSASAPSPPAPSPPAYQTATIECGPLPNRAGKLITHHVPLGPTSRLLRIEGIANNPGVAAMPITCFADPNVLAYAVTVIVFWKQILLLCSIDYSRFTESTVTFDYIL